MTTLTLIDWDGVTSCLHFGQASNTQPAYLTTLMRGTGHSPFVFLGGFGGTIHILHTLNPFTEQGLHSQRVYKNCSFSLHPANRLTSIRSATELYSVCPSWAAVLCLWHTISQFVFLCTICYSLFLCRKKWGSRAGKEKQQKVES